MNARQDARGGAAGGLRLRRALAQDIDGLQLLEASFPGDRLRRSALLRFVRSASADVWVAEDDGVVVGDAVVLYRRGFAAARLYSVVVDPARRGRGVGAALLAHAEREAIARGCVAMRLEVRGDNHAAQRLYAARGYEVVGSTDDFYEDGSAALRLRKRFIAAHAHLHVVPYYQQSLDFTCGPAALMMAMRAVGWSEPFTQDQELAIWRESTTVFMQSGHGGTSAHGLALAARRRGVRARVWVADDEVPFLDSVRSEEKKRVIALSHAAFAAALADDPDAVRIGPFDQADVVAQLRAGVIPLMLVSGWRLYGQRVPHWVVVTGWDDHHLYVHDPFVPEGTERADAIHLPLPRRDVARVARYGRAAHRAMVLLGPAKRRRAQPGRGPSAASPSIR